MKYPENEKSEDFDPENEAGDCKSNQVEIFEPILIYQSPQI